MNNHADSLSDEDYFNDTTIGIIDVGQTGSETDLIEKTISVKAQRGRKPKSALQPSMASTSLALSTSILANSLSDEEYISNISISQTGSENNFNEITIPVKAKRGRMPKSTLAPSTASTISAMLTSSNSLVDSLSDEYCINNVNIGIKVAGQTRSETQVIEKTNPLKARRGRKPKSALQPSISTNSLTDEECINNASICQTGSETNFIEKNIPVKAKRGRKPKSALQSSTALATSTNSLTDESCINNASICQTGSETNLIEKNIPVKAKRGRKPKTALAPSTASTSLALSTSNLANRLSDEEYINNASISQTGSENQFNKKTILAKAKRGRKPKSALASSTAQSLALSTSNLTNSFTDEEYINQTGSENHVNDIAIPVKAKRGRKPKTALAPSTASTSMAISTSNLANSLSDEEYINNASISQTGSENQFNHITIPLKSKRGRKPKLALAPSTSLALSTSNVANSFSDEENINNASISQTGSENHFNHITFPVKAKRGRKPKSALTPSTASTSLTMSTSNLANSLSNEECINNATISQICTETHLIEKIIPVKAKRGRKPKSTLPPSTVSTSLTMSTSNPVNCISERDHLNNEFVVDSQTDSKTNFIDITIPVKAKRGRKPKSASTALAMSTKNPVSSISNKELVNNASNNIVLDSQTGSDAHYIEKIILVKAKRGRKPKSALPPLTASTSLSMSTKSLLNSLSDEERINNASNDLLGGSQTDSKPNFIDITIPVKAKRGRKPKSALAPSTASTSLPKSTKCLLNSLSDEEGINNASNDFIVGSQTDSRPHFIDITIPVKAKRGRKPKSALPSSIALATSTSKLATMAKWLGTSNAMSTNPEKSVG